MTGMHYRTVPVRLVLRGAVELLLRAAPAHFLGGRKHERVCMDPAQTCRTHSSSRYNQGSRRSYLRAPSPRYSYLKCWPRATPAHEKSSCRSRNPLARIQFLFPTTATTPRTSELGSWHPLLLLVRRYLTIADRPIYTNNSRARKRMMT